MKSSGLDINAGSYAETGQIANLLKSNKLDIDIGEFALTGQVAGVYYNRKVSAESGSFDWTGFDIDLIYTPGGEYSIIAGAGSFDWMGQDVEFNYSRIIDIGSGAYIETGFDALLSRIVPRLEYTKNSFICRDEGFDGVIKRSNTLDMGIESGKEITSYITPTKELGLFMKRELSMEIEI